MPVAFVAAGFFISRMKKIVGYIEIYIRSLHVLAFICCTVFMAGLIFCNYHFQLNQRINSASPVWQYIAWFVIFLSVFLFGYAAQTWRTSDKLFQKPMFLFLSAFAAALFSWKMTARFDFFFTENSIENAYWNHVVYWPLKLLVIVLALYFVWLRHDRRQPFYGTATRRFNTTPYLLLLALMVPLLWLASTQPDFQAVYPKLKNIHFLSGGAPWFHKLLYELSYGSDFITIELFFRGFLVLAFTKWAGAKAVLPMALFYCTIHFGKPPGECISSYFGGLLLGAVTLQTRSVWGGLMVHLGIAWLMEVFGFLHL